MADPDLDDLALLLLYLASWEEKGEPGRRAWKNVPFETLNALTGRGFLEDNRRAKSVWLTAEGIARARDLGRRLLLPDSMPAPGPLLGPGSAFELLRVALRGVEPPIWRRFRVPAELSLPALHRVLQRVMGWRNAHLHEFVAGGISFSDPAEEDNYDPIDERRLRLSQLIRRPGDRITYVYDFGDGWLHDLMLERVVHEPPVRSSVVCLAGARACPPEDCGGIGGYAAFLAAIGDPTDDRHDELRDWIGGHFDSEHFDLGAVNRALARLARRPPRG
jgi:hypothetical protein